MKLQKKNNAAAPGSDGKHAGVGLAILSLLITLMLVCSAALVLGGRGNSPRFVFGYSILWVKTPSMSPTIEEQSYILVRRADSSDPAGVGDVIVFFCPDASSPVFGELITHRVVGGDSVNGYRTKGDHPASMEDPWTVSAEEVTARYVRTLPIVTVIGRILFSRLGLLLIAGAFLAVCAFGCLPAVLKVYNEAAARRASAAREQEMARRVEEEVNRLMSEQKTADQPPQPPSRKT